MPRQNEGLMDRGGLELMSLLSRPYTYTKIGACLQNNYTQIIKRHQVVWQNGSIRVHCPKDPRFDTHRPRMFNQTEKLIDCSILLEL